MKIRQGFVSNSSSSSFIVAFPKIPKDAFEVRLILFPNGTFIQNPYDEGVTAIEKISKIVWDDIKRKKPNNYNRIRMHCRGIADFAFDSIYQSMPNCSKKDLDLFFRNLHREERILIKNLMHEWKDKFIYTFTYSDEDGGFWSVMEHGNIFRNLPHKVISHH